MAAEYNDFVSRPELPLEVKATFDKSHRRITFSNCRTVTFDLLRHKVERCFSLSRLSWTIAYKDDDGEVTDITNDFDVTEAIHYFGAGADDGAMSSASSILSGLSGRSFRSRRITLRVHVTVDYDGPSLSDTSSLVSLDEYRERRVAELNDRRSEHSFSLGARSQGPVDDDSVTVSSRDHGSLAQPAVTRETAEGSISLSNWDEETSYVSRSSSSLVNATRRADPNAERATSPSYGANSVFDRLRREHPPPSSYGDGRSRQETDPRTAWLRDQSNRAIQSMLGGLPAPSESDALSFSLNGSEPPASEAGPVSGDLALERAPSGKYYYSYTSSGASQIHEAMGPELNGSSSDYLSPQHTGSSQAMAHASGSKSPHRPPLAPFNSDPVTVRDREPLYEELAPEVVQFLGPPAHELTDCSSCGTVLDMMRYVCATCGPKPPREGARQADSLVPEEGGKGKSRAPSPGYPPASHRSNSGSSSGSGSGTTTIPRFDREHGAGFNVPGLFQGRINLSMSMQFGPNAGNSSTPQLVQSPPDSATSTPLLNGVQPRTTRSASGSGSGSGSTTAYNDGYELCAGCIESVGVVHAVDAGLAGHSVTGSPVVGSPSPSLGTPSSPEDTLRTLAQWRRTAPRTKGQLRHAYIEKVWGTKGWEDVEHDDGNTPKCSTCNSAIIGTRYKCLSCQKLDLCKACYSQVHEVHPSHAFLEVRDKPQRSRSEPDLVPTIADVEPSGEESLKHPGVKCAHCMQDIIGARFHCAFCDNIDICSNCESAGLPGNLDSADGGHSSSHIMIKIPFPLQDTQVQGISRRAVQHWTGQKGDAERPRSRSNSIHSGYARTVIGSRSAATQSVTGDEEQSHEIRCNYCNKMIVGVRYQCANCPSSPDMYNLCASCEPRSYIAHDPMHIFFKLPRPVRQPLRSSAPFLPYLYKSPAGPLYGPENPIDPKEYLRTLVHTAAVCDRCMTRIQGEWFRCAYCAKDLCDACEAVDTHDASHCFIVFKSAVDMPRFRHFAELDNQQGSPPVIRYPIY